MKGLGVQNFSDNNETNNTLIYDLTINHFYVQILQKNLWLELFLARRATL